MPLTEAQKRAKAKYNQKVTKVTIEFYPSDAELLEKVQEQENKQAYIKELIKKDLG
jgi:tRNA U54 and U55 pseudouridine synthase Pus10